VDGVITRGEGQSVELEILERLAATNEAAQRDPSVPAIALCTGRQGPYIELMAQLIGGFLPCIFEHGAGLFFPTTFRFEFEPPDYAQRLARLRAIVDEPLIKSGRAFVQPGKEATMTLYPLGSTSVDDLFQLVQEVISDFDVERNVHGVEVRPPGINKGAGARRLAAILGVPLESMAGVGDSDPDLSYLTRVGFSAAPANATRAVRAAVNYVSEQPYGAGLLEIVTLVERRNGSRV
jgi:hydroxymethylpyrimidine pyrophosphatase-like HAD family hydrolase